MSKINIPGGAMVWLPVEEIKWLLKQVQDKVSPPQGVDHLLLEEVTPWLRLQGRLQQALSQVELPDSPPAPVGRSGLSGGEKADLMDEYRKRSLTEVPDPVLPDVK